MLIHVVMWLRPELSQTACALWSRVRIALEAWMCVLVLKCSVLWSCGDSVTHLCPYPSVSAVDWNRAPRLFCFVSCGMVWHDSIRDHANGWSPIQSLLPRVQKDSWIKIALHMFLFCSMWCDSRYRANCRSPIQRVLSRARTIRGFHFLFTFSVLRCHGGVFAVGWLPIRESLNYF
jgi:hypothetical protein